jgi:hypothetical protein
MTDARPISAEQLKRLQTLYSQLAATSADPRTKTRQERLLWASLICNREIASFSKLTAEEAKRAIDSLQKKLKPKKPRQRMDRDRARRHGVDGRSDGKEFSSAPEMATAYDLEVIEGYYARLSWSRETFDSWLRSPRSPLGRKSQPQIRTVAEANRVRWALVRMLKKAGRWEAAPPGSESRPHD